MEFFPRLKKRVRVAYVPTGSCAQKQFRLNGQERITGTGGGCGFLESAIRAVGIKLHGKRKNGRAGCVNRRRLQRTLFLSSTCGVSR